MHIDVNVHASHTTRDETNRWMAIPSMTSISASPALIAPLGERHFGDCRSYRLHGHDLWHVHRGHTKQQIVSVRTDCAGSGFNNEVGLFPLSTQGAAAGEQMLPQRAHQVVAIHHVAHRYMVLLWYLNDVNEGGETRFPQLGHSVQARAGTLLMFPPYWMYQHEGVAPASGDKYILSTYLLFTTSPGNPSAAGMAAE